MTREEQKIKLRHLLKHLRELMRHHGGHCGPIILAGLTRVHFALFKVWRQKKVSRQKRDQKNKMEQLTKQDIAGALYLLITIGFYVMLPGILEMVLIQNIFWYYHLI